MRSSQMKTEVAELESERRKAVERKIQTLGEWFHNIEIDGVMTAPNHFLGDYPNMKWRQFCNAVPNDLRGKTVLDIGCNAGFYSIEMKRRGADHVLGIDFDERYLAQAQFAAQSLGFDIDFRKLSVYDLHEIREKLDD